MCLWLQVSQATTDFCQRVVDTLRKDYVYWPRQGIHDEELADIEAGFAKKAGMWWVDVRWLSIATASPSLGCVS